MLKTPIDHDAMVTMFANATAQQGEQLRRAVFDATLRTLQGRELTLENIRTALQTVTQAASTGIAKNVLPPVDAQAVLTDAVHGMDDALLQAVEANRVALQQFVDQGVDLQDKNLRKAVEMVEQMEDALFKAVGQSAAGAGASLAQPWNQVLEKMKLSGTHTGAQATQTVEQLTAQMQTAMRDSRAAGLRAAQTFAQSYAALASGVLLGMADALKQGSTATAAPAAKRPRGKA